MTSNDIGGVWRTIGGKRVFIKDGEDLKTAMKKSGKFKKNEMNDKDEKKNTKMTDEEREKKIKELEKKKEETVGFLQKGAIQEEIDMLKDNFEGTKEEYREHLSKEREKRLKEYEEEKQERLKIKKEQENEENERGYKMAHRPSKGATLDDITSSVENENDDYSPAMPKDFYEHPEYYGNMNDVSYKESFEAIKKARGNKDGTVTIYRATTGETINDGDWITLSKSYAEHHNNTWLGDKGKVIKMEVPIKDVRFAGDDFNEFGYFPEKNKKNKR